MFKFFSLFCFSLISLTTACSQNNSSTQPVSQQSGTKKLDSIPNRWVLNEQQGEKLLLDSYWGSHDTIINANPLLGSDVGNCKSCFMNVQHRYYNSTLSPENKEHCRLAKDLTQMYNGLFDTLNASQALLISPQNKVGDITLQAYKKTKNKKEITTNIIPTLLDTIQKLPHSSGYYCIAVGIAARFHLTHLIIDYRDSTAIKYYMFDNFGLGGKYLPSQTLASLTQHAMTAEEVEKYYRNYLAIAVGKFLKSKTLKNATISYGKDWPSYERPLYSEVYFVNPFIH